MSSDILPAAAPTVFAGSEIVWTYRVTNPGTQTLYGIYVYHEGEGHVTCPSTRLGPGETMACIGTGIAEEGLYVGHAWVDAWAEDGSYLADADPSHYFGIW